MIPDAFGAFVAQNATQPPPGTNWVNIGLIVGMVVSVLTAAVAFYRAGAQRRVDVNTGEKIDQEVRRLQTEHDRRRTVRVLRLERYVDQDINYHRELNEHLAELSDLVEEAMRQGYLPKRKLRKPPSPPQLPDMPNDAGDP